MGKLGTVVTVSEIPLAYHEWETDRLYTGGMHTGCAGLRSSEPRDSDSNKVEDEDQHSRSTSDLYPSTLFLPSLFLTCVQASTHIHTHSSV